MYSPAAFVVNDRKKLHDFIQRHSFATLISTDTDGAPSVSHVPLLLDRERGEHGQLIGHIAKTNPQWQSAVGQQVLAIFHGPHAYVSPTWYEDQKVVPTWNYVAVHATGKIEFQHDPKRIRSIVEDAVAFYEADMPTPWQMNSQDPDFIDGLCNGVVGLTIDIGRLDGKWRLNQNHPVERRQRVIDGLRQRNGVGDQPVAEFMEESLDEPTP